MDIANYRLDVIRCGVKLLLLINQYSAILNSHQWRVLGETCSGRGLWWLPRRHGVNVIHNMFIYFRFVIIMNFGIIL